MSDVSMMVENKKETSAEKKKRNKSKKRTRVSSKVVKDPFAM